MVWGVVGPPDGLRCARDGAGAVGSAGGRRDGVTQEQGAPDRGMREARRIRSPNGTGKGRGRVGEPEAARGPKGPARSRSPSADPIALQTQAPQI